jgi:tetratricopeptide (TPR) repeat protein
MQWQSVSDPATAHNNLAAILIEQGKYSDARRELDAALRYRQDYSPALRNLALVAELDGRAATMPGKKDPGVSTWKRLARGVRWVFVGPVDGPGHEKQGNEKQPAAGAAAR